MRFAGVCFAGVQTTASSQAMVYMWWLVTQQHNHCLLTASASHHSSRCDVALFQLAIKHAAIALLFLPLLLCLGVLCGSLSMRAKLGRCAGFAHIIVVQCSLL